MISSLILKGRYNVGVNSSNRIMLDGEVTPLTDVPFIRYRFGDFGDENIEFLKSNMSRLHGPCHLAEYDISTMPKEQLEDLNAIDGLAIYAYIDIDDADLSNGIAAEKVEKLKSISDLYFDRLIIRDKSSMMYPLAADKLTFELSDILGGAVKASDIGICCSPLTPRTPNSESKACLSAVWARRLMADYTDNVDVATPTANHECCSDGCCCIRAFTVTCDIPAPANDAKVADSSSSENGCSKKANSEGGADAKEAKKPKAPKSKGVTSFNDLV